MISAAVVGATGYTGGELLRILLQHPEVRVVRVTSESKPGRPLAEAEDIARKEIPP
ncbi:MAG TPA: N-acetyl-gamma-glutamyl-phosphate reductase, partial [Elusimicrobiota bacterium]|nr:N-acetyl-gamma-glutamyl-phosphate reductase [Elusimicrobiota bacterium]